MASEMINLANFILDDNKLLMFVNAIKSAQNNKIEE